MAETDPTTGHVALSSESLRCPLDATGHRLFRSQYDYPSILPNKLFTLRPSPGVCHSESMERMDENE